MARQYWISGVYGDFRKDQAIIRICNQAVSVDPDYAEAWALMALAQAELRFWHGMSEDALPAAERALALNPDLPEARCVKARYLESDGRADEAGREIATALRLDPESWEVNREAARIMFRAGRMPEAIRYFEKAAELMTGDFHSPGMLMTCYLGTRQDDLRGRAAKLTIERAEAALAKDPANGVALALGAAALLTFGEKERAKEWIQRALLLDPDNHSTLYNLACAYAVEANDVDSALPLLAKWLERVNSTTVLKHAEANPDLEQVRRDPRFEEMLADAKARLEGGR
jgi:adenylate cyclase